MVGATVVDSANGARATSTLIEGSFWEERQLPERSFKFSAGNVPAAPQRSDAQTVLLEHGPEGAETFAAVAGESDGRLRIRVARATLARFECLNSSRGQLPNGLPDARIEIVQKCRVRGQTELLPAPERELVVAYLWHPAKNACMQPPRADRLNVAANDLAVRGCRPVSSRGGAEGGSRTHTASRRTRGHGSIPNRGLRPP
jgi:hypothetical protein